MKNLIIATLLSLITFVNVNAQTVVKNNYDSTTTEKGKEQSISDFFSLVNLQYMSFDGFDNYGLIINAINPNGIGFDLGFRANFEKHGNYNSDLGVNYSFELTNNNDLAAYLILAVGPSLRMQDKFDSYDKRGNIKYKDGFFVDGYINPRLSIKYKRIVASVGYFYWAPKFKFSKDDGATGGLNLALGFEF